jgi:hypothetical protein
LRLPQVAVREVPSLASRQSASGVAAGPDGDRSSERSRSLEVHRASFGFRRRPVDDQGGYRRGCASTCSLRRALPTLHLAGRRVLAWRGSRGKSRRARSAEIAARRGDLAEAEKELSHGIAVLREHPAALEGWKIQAALGRLHRRAGNSEGSRLAFAEASAIIRSIAGNTSTTRCGRGS